MERHHQRDLRQLKPVLVAMQGHIYLMTVIYAYPVLQDHIRSKIPRLRVYSAHWVKPQLQVHHSLLYPTVVRVYLFVRQLDSTRGSMGLVQLVPEVFIVEVEMLL